ncbi:hypothetical protein QBC36DRAFT_357047 [Triangularia setosa]|uniref:Lectin n=1 Tax=Triangularia setosa TaxID=2587417 RepID=A0AAN6W3Z1_9PEZI|nr:hypothetical protein QBC36DRAFT_357047 [Podospora setosa]
MKPNLTTPAWALALMAAITNASPILQLSPRTDNRDTVYAKNWAGLAINTTTDSPISALTGVIQVPKFFPPPTGDYTNISFVINLGTNGDCGSAASAGIDMAILKDGTATFAAWSHASYDGHGREPLAVNWMDDMRGSRFEIQAGDEITITLKTQGHRNVWLQWNNTRTSDNLQLKIKDYKTDLCLTYASWVTEQRPALTVGQDPGVFTTPDFGTVVIKGMEWGAEDGQVWKTGKRKGPAKENWFAIGEENEWGHYIDTGCGFFGKAEDVDDQGMKCTQEKASGR